jgi:hypothetical protein
MQTAKFSATKKVEPVGIDVAESEERTLICPTAEGRIKGILVKNV